MSQGEQRATGNKEVGRPNEAEPGRETSELYRLTLRDLNKKHWTLVLTVAVIALLFLVANGVLLLTARRCLGKAAGEVAAAHRTHQPPAAAQRPEAAQGRPEQASDLYADFLKLWIPGLLVLIGAAAGALGLTRLTQIDGEIGNLHRMLDEQLIEERKLARDDRSDFEGGIEERVQRDLAALRDQLEREMNDARSDAERMVRQEVAERFEEQDQAMRAHLHQIDERQQQIRDAWQPYAWLVEQEVDVRFFADIRTMQIAHSRATDLRMAERKHEALKVIQYALENDLPGDPDDIHNLSVEAASFLEEVHLAARVAAKGAERFPQDVDTVADCVKYFSNTGEFKQAARYADQLRGIPQAHWNWRAFVFLGDYLESISKVEEAMDLYEDFRSVLPDEERGWSQPGLYYWRMGRYEEARPFLEKGLEACSTAAQCACALSQLYKDTGRYEKAIEAADRALRDAAEAQPSVNEAVIAYHRAGALDALLLDLLQGLPSEPSDDQVREALHYARRCAASYREVTAMSSAAPPAMFALRTRDRLRILRSELLARGFAEDLLEAVGMGVDLEAELSLPAELLEQLREQLGQEEGTGGVTREERPTFGAEELA